jgi:hypothetical protein
LDVRRPDPVKALPAVLAIRVPPLPTDAGCTDRTAVGWDGDLASALRFPILKSRQRSTPFDRFRYL